MTGNVLSNDTDGDVDALTVTGFTVAGVTGTHAAGATVSLVGVGSLTLGADGGYSFVPVANYNGNVPVVTYTVSDGVDTATATSSLTVRR